MSTTEDTKSEHAPEVTTKIEGCCGGPSTTKGACCVKDEKAKALGASGCGCATKAAQTKKCC